MTPAPVWGQHTCRVEITASLRGADSGAALELAIRGAIRECGAGATVSRAIGYWCGAREHATRVELLIDGDNPDPDWQLRAIVGAALTEGCTAVQVERFPCRAEEWRAT